MAETSIEWTATRNADGTVTSGVSWNPVRGCSRVSEGCRNCYAERQAYRITQFDRGRGIDPGMGAYDNLVTMTSQGPKWTGRIREVREKLDEPLHWKKPKRVFVNSMGDLFHPKVSTQYIAEVFAYMAYARQHTFIVLTKQPQRMQQLLTSDEFAQLYDEACSAAGADAEEVLGARGQFSPLARLTTDIRAMDPTLPRPNIQLGVSVEDQATYETRVPLLLQTPAAIRLISAEPLLGPIDLHFDLPWWVSNDGRRLDWVIAGGESGNDARWMHPTWVRALRDQCVTSKVPFFFKQWGEWTPGHIEDPADGNRYWEDEYGTGVNVQGRHRTETIDGVAYCKVSKQAAGRMLDGREWNEIPEAPRCS